MRRPLFGTGFPKRMLFDDGVIKVFDTNDFTPQENAPLTFAVTLFCWPWQNYIPTNLAPILANLPFPVVTVAANGGTPIGVAQRSNADVASMFAAQTFDMAKPIKLLDRYVVRGDQQIFAGNVNPNSTLANGVSCAIFGYFETVGVHELSAMFRPLQPSNPVAPFSAPVPVITSNVPNTKQYATAHQLYFGFTDVLTLNANNGAIGNIEVGSDAEAFFKFPGANVAEQQNVLAIPFAQAHVLLQSQPFVGQPVTPASKDDLNILFGFETTGTLPGAGTAAITAYGNMLRH